jgi:hypothetical protein
VSGLWVPDQAGLFADGSGLTQPDLSAYAGLKACSVRELETWIRDHIRFDVEHMAKAQPLTFGTTATKVEEAAALPGRGKKVAYITHDYRVADDAKDPAERTYGQNTWKRADGTEKSKVCEHSVLGVVVAGVGYGETFQVCVARDKCQIHWKKEIAERERSARQRASGRGQQAAQREAEARQREEAQRQAQETRWKTFYPALRKEALTAVAKTPQTLPGALFRLVLKQFNLPKGTTPAQLAKALLVAFITQRFNEFRHAGSEEELVALAKLLGVNIRVCEASAALPDGDGDKPAKKGGAKK